MKHTRPTPISSIARSGVRADTASMSAFGGIIGCCFVMCLAAQVRIPVPGTDVPMTLQSLAMLLTGFALCPMRAVAAMLLYLACGAAGLPVFAAGSAGLLGPTGGYLFGFVAAAWMVGVLKCGGRPSYRRLLGAGAAGMALLFSLGVGWRVLLFHGDIHLAVATGLIPFAAKAVVQVFLAATLVSSIGGWRRGRRGALSNG